jgi:hypothetical protein
MPLTNLGEVKNFLGINTAAFDVRLDALRASAEALVERWCKRKFSQATYTEYLEGDGSAVLPLSQRPVSVVNSVALATRGSYGAVPGDYTTLVAGFDYTLRLRESSLGNSGELVKLTGVWPTQIDHYVGRLSWERRAGLGNVKAVYTAGYTIIPDDIKYAVALVVGYMFRTAKRGGQDYSERLGDHSYMIPMARIREAPALGEARQILSVYRESGW